MIEPIEDLIVTDESRGFPVFELWKEYEKIAMHFNDLILKLRVQALGAVAAITTLVGLLTKDLSAQEIRWGVLFSIFSFLTVFWVAIWILDFCYYNRLLHGAVDALLRIEDASKNGKFVSAIEISSRIEGANHGESTRVREQRFSPRSLFYLIVLIALVAASIYTYRRYVHV